MQITTLKIHTLRNLQHIVVSPHPRFNLILGENGSGKSSLLEALYLLSRGRSFRERQLNTLMTHQADRLSVFARLAMTDKPCLGFGLEKTRSGKTEIRVAGESKKAADLATLLPVQFINPELFQLLTMGSLARRQFLDWGVFHEASSFLGQWQRYNRILKHRNLLLKKKNVDLNALKAFEETWGQSAEQITQMRQEHADRLWGQTKQILNGWNKLGDIEFEYWPGWDTTMSFQESLERSFAADRRYGACQVGPHRSDLKFKIYGLSARQVLSRGQQKLLVGALFLAQSYLLREQGKAGIFLLDDIASELDEENRRLMLEPLFELGGQIFLTGVESEPLVHMIQDRPHLAIQLSQGHVINELKTAEPAV